MVKPYKSIENVNHGYIDIYRYYTTILYWFKIIGISDCFQNVIIRTFYPKKYISYHTFLFSRQCRVVSASCKYIKILQQYSFQWFKNNNFINYNDWSPYTLDNDKRLGSCLFYTFLLVAQLLIMESLTFCLLMSYSWVRVIREFKPPQMQKSVFINTHVRHIYYFS